MLTLVETLIGCCTSVELCFHRTWTEAMWCSTADAPADGAHRVSLSGGEEAELQEPKRRMEAGGCHGNGPRNAGASREEHGWSESATDILSCDSSFADVVISHQCDASFYIFSVS